MRFAIISARVSSTGATGAGGTLNKVNGWKGGGGAESVIN